MQKTDISRQGTNFPSGGGSISTYQSSQNFQGNQITHTWTHNLGVYPKGVQMIARCTTAEDFWTVGDRYIINPAENWNGTYNSGVKLTANTLIWRVYAGSLAILRGAGGGDNAAVISANKWAIDLTILY
jgi:hypothetical protein